MLEMLERRDVDYDTLLSDMLIGGRSSEEDCMSLVHGNLFYDLKRISEDIYSSGVEGEVVECGCWRGGYAIAMAYLFKDRFLRVFDAFDKSFQPLAESVYDYSGAERHSDEHGYLDVSCPDVKRNFAKFGLTTQHAIHFKEGWVRDTLYKPVVGAGIKSIAMLHIDVDAYSATREVLEALYDLVSPGGYVVLDDHNLHEARDAVADFFDDRDESVVIHRVAGHHDDAGAWIKK